MLYVGIDVAKSKHDVTVIDNTGKMVLKPITITNRKQGFELLHTYIKTIIRFTPIVPYSSKNSQSLSHFVKQKRIRKMHV